MTKYKLSKHVNDKSYYLNINLAKNSAYSKKQRTPKVSFETAICAAALACALAALALIISLK